MPPRPIDPNAPLEATGVSQELQVAPPTSAGPNLGLPQIDPVAQEQLSQAAAQAQLQQQLAQQIAPQEDLTAASAMAGLGGLVSFLAGAPEAARVGLDALNSARQRNKQATQEASALISRAQNEVQQQDALRRQQAELEALRKAAPGMLSDPILTDDQRAALRELMAANPKEGLKMYQDMREESRREKHKKLDLEINYARLTETKLNNELLRIQKRLLIKEMEAGDYEELPAGAQQKRDVKAVEKIAKDKEINTVYSTMAENMVRMKSIIGTDFRSERAQELFREIGGNWKNLYQGKTGILSDDAQELWRLISATGFLDAFRKGGKQLTGKEIGAAETISGIDLSDSNVGNMMVKNPERYARAFSILDTNLRRDLNEKAFVYKTLSPKISAKLEEEGSYFAPGVYDYLSEMAPLAYGANLETPPEGADDPGMREAYRKATPKQRMEIWVDFYKENPHLQPKPKAKPEGTPMDWLKRPFGIR